MENAGLKPLTPHAKKLQTGVYDRQHFMTRRSSCGAGIHTKSTEQMMNVAHAIVIRRRLGMVRKLFELTFPMETIQLKIA